MASRMLACGRPDVGRQDAMRQPHQRLVGGVRVNRAEAAEVARVQGLQQIECLGAAHLADEDAIGPMPERRPQQVGDGHRPAAAPRARAAPGHAGPRAGADSACRDGSRRSLR